MDHSLSFVIVTHKTMLDDLGIAVNNHKFGNVTNLYYSFQSHCVRVMINIIFCDVCIDEAELAQEVEPFSLSPEPVLRTISSPHSYFKPGSTTKLILPPRQHGTQIHDVYHQIYVINRFRRYRRLR